MAHVLTDRQYEDICGKIDAMKADLNSTRKEAKCARVIELAELNAARQTILAQDKRIKELEEELAHKQDKDGIVILDGKHYDGLIARIAELENTLDAIHDLIRPARVKVCVRQGIPDPSDQSDPTDPSDSRTPNNPSTGASPSA